MLVALHAVDPAAVGLGGFGRPEGFLERQVRRWGSQLDASRSRDLPDADELHAASPRSSPTSRRPAIVHGDYRLDNVLVDADGTGEEVRAVLDWEMATLGDPLTDLALLLVYTGWPRSPAAPRSRTPARRPATPTPTTQLERYAAASGRDLVPDRLPPRARATSSSP